MEFVAFHDHEGHGEAMTALRYTVAVTDEDCRKRKATRLETGTGWCEE